MKIANFINSHFYFILGSYFTLIIVALIIDAFIN